MSIYNVDELIPPSWINQEFLEKVLTQYENNGDVQVIKFDLSPASVKGDHYASIMFRCKVSYGFGKTENTLQKSIIIKTLPMEDNMKREMLMQSKLFETEILMYSETLPKIEKILAECGEPTKLSAGLIYHALEPQKVIILEDLCEAGYDPIRGRPLTEEEFKAVYRKIAKLHAVSYMMGQSENYEEVTKYQDGLFSTDLVASNDLMANGIVTFIDMLSCHEEFEEVHEKVKAMKSTLLKRCTDLYTVYQKGDKENQNGVLVLNHGDFHIKNLMFKFSKKNQMDDIIMVDYQLSCYGPSNIDMMYSQFMMMSPELRLKRNELMQYYFKEFLKILKKINYQKELPLYSEFQIASLKYRHFSIFLLSTFLPMFISVLGKSGEELKDTDTDKIFESSDTMAMLYRTPAFIDEVRKLMPILLREGYLD